MMDMNYPLIYERLEGEILRLQGVAKHDQELRNP